MPEGMEVQLVVEAGRPDVFLEAAGDRPGLEWASLVRVEKILALYPEVLLPLPQQPAEFFVHRNDTVLACLGGEGLTVPDKNHLAGEVNVYPPEREQLAKSHPGQQSGDAQLPEVPILDHRQEYPEIALREVGREDLRHFGL